MDGNNICISSLPQDAAMANTLADRLRRYRLPGGVTVPGSGALRQVLLDTDGSECSERIRETLLRCDFLVVLCSPEVRTHRGMLDRLDFFRGARGGDHVIAVLVQGEPYESFPENFSEKKLVKHIMPDMSVVEREEVIEPIAADLRADTPAKRRAALRYETVRITASVLGLHPDALEQRHQARHRRTVITVLSLAAAVAFTAAGIFLRLGLLAKREGDIAREQTRLSASIAARTMEELPDLFAGDDQALAYVDEAVAAARASLEELGLDDLLTGEAKEAGP